MTTTTNSRWIGDDSLDLGPADPDPDGLDLDADRCSNSDNILSNCSSCASCNILFRTTTKFRDVDLRFRRSPIRYFSTSESFRGRSDSKRESAAEEEDETSSRSQEDPEVAGARAADNSARLSSTSRVTSSEVTSTSLKRLPAMLTSQVRNLYSDMEEGDSLTGSSDIGSA
jgi:hypothetical protein